MAILEGLASDGGLFVPCEFPKIDISDKKYLRFSYKDFAKEILSLYLSDFTIEEINFCVESAYTDKFDNEEVVPVKKAGNFFFVELFHGKTLSYKDVSLSILPYLILTAKEKNRIKEDILMISATCKNAGLEAFKDMDEIKLVLYYPNNKVSEIESIQMTSQKAENLRFYDVDGNLDDVQNAVKRALNNDVFKKELKDKGYVLSSASSINIGCLIPQIVYYFTSYFHLVKTGEIELGEKINIAIPSANLGNTLAAFYAKKMGLAVNRLVCASNANKVLADFFLSMGTYNIRRKFYKTESPSMDILMASNFERLLYHASEEDTKFIREKMEKLQEKHVLNLSLRIMANLDSFSGESCGKSRSKLAIKNMFSNYGYLIDPHTAIAVRAYEKYNEKKLEKHKVLLVSTSSPFMFPRFVIESIDKKMEEGTKFIAAIKRLEVLSGIKIPKVLAENKFYENKLNEVIDESDLEDSIFSFLS